MELRNAEIGRVSWTPDSALLLQSGTEVIDQRQAGSQEIVTHAPADALGVLCQFDTS